ncbi:MAG: glycosyltransferase family 2 protein [Algoriphagus sp.]|nr:glycosyltransferase family 2 protein [Algoriphagus sp.]
MEPKFSVIIPTYNRSATLGRVIQSVLGQTLPAWEIIVVDDGSLDDTRELVKTFPQVRYHFQANSGVCAARNKGAEIATGDWLIFLDSDDELLSEALSVFWNQVQANSNITFFKCGFLIIKNTGALTEISPNKRVYTAPIPASFFLSKSLFNQVKGYNTNISYSENTELFLRLSSLGFEPLVFDYMSMIYHESAIGGSKNLKNMDLSLELILKSHSKFLKKIDNWNLYQTLGVIQLRRGRFSAARSTLKKAISFRPTHLATYLRLAIAYLPFLSRRIYTSSSFTA